MSTKTHPSQHLEQDAIEANVESLHEALPEAAAHMRARRASTPGSAIKTIYWRGDVISVVNKYFGYELVGRHVEPGQEWFWTDSWQSAIRSSVEAVEAGHGTVFTNEDDFLAFLDE